MIDDRADEADADANAGHRCEQPPPDDRERRRDSGTESGDQPADGVGACQCAGGGSGSDAVKNVDGNGDGDGYEDGDGVEGSDGDEHGDAEPASTERYLGWLKLWRVVLLVILALVRLIRAL